MSYIANTDNLDIPVAGTDRRTSWMDHQAIKAAALRIPNAERGVRQTLLPDAAGRANKVVGFDGDGDVLMVTPGQSIPVLLELPAFSFTTSEEAVEEFPTTQPSGYNGEWGTQIVEFDFISTGYFEHNPSGHIAVVLRSEANPEAVRGRGLLIGSSPAVAYGPTTQLETWFNSIEGVPVGAEELIPNTEGYSDKLLADDQIYRVVVYASNRGWANRFIRYQLYKFDVVRAAWDLERDSGDVKDFNIWADPNASAVTFAHVFGNNVDTWEVEFSNVKIRWVAGNWEAATEQPTWLRAAASEDNFDGNLDASLTFLGDSRRVRVKSNYTGADLPKNTAVQSRDANTVTDFIAIPNGTAVGANFLAFSKSGMTTSNITLIGSNNGRNELKAIAVGEACNPLYIQQNAIDHLEFNSRSIRVGREGDDSQFALRINSWAATLSNAFRIRDSRTNSPTQLWITPAGSGTEAYVSMGSRSGMDLASFSYLQVGMANSYARIESFGVGALAHPDIHIRPGGVTRLTAKAAEGEVEVNGALRINGATTAMGTGSAVWAGVLGSGNLRGAATNTSITQSEAQAFYDLLIMEIFTKFGNLIMDLKARKVIQ